MQKSMYLKMFCVVVVFAIILCGLVSCDEGGGDNDHIHTFSMWETTTEATCTTQGVQTRKCTTCGFVEKETYPTTDHDWEAATYTAPKTCSTCGLTEGAPLEKVELTAEEIYEKASPSVVEVTAESAREISTGTGFFIDNNGTIVTNYHVIEKCTSATITLADGRIFEVKKVLGYSESKDIAVLSTGCTNSIPLELRKTAVKTGEKVYAIGSSLGLTGSMSEGIISSAQRELDGQIFIQTTAPISHGNSGGPLMDSAGMVVGITTATFADGQNLNFAVPVSEIDTISRNNPTTLPELFPQNVKWISEWDFFYYDDDEEYVLVFQLSDEDEIPMSASGQVDIKIVNDDGITVYNKTRSFTEEDFYIWTEDDSTEWYLATISIKPDDIMQGTCFEGTVYFTVYGDDFAFEETTLYVSDLPVDAFEILANHIFMYGEYNSQYKWYNVYKSYDYSTYYVDMSLTYFPEDDNLAAYIWFENSDNSRYTVYLTLDNDINGLYYSGTYSVKNGRYSQYEERNRTWGYIDPNQFTDKTVLTYEEYDGLPSQETVLLKAYAANIQDLLDWLSVYLRTESVGITIADLGFTSYQ